MKELESASLHPYRIGLIVFLGVLTIFFGLNIALVIPYVLAILVGAMLSVLARGPYNTLRRKKGGPKISATIIVAGICLLVIIPFSAFMTLATQQAITLGQWLIEKDAFSLDILNKKILKIGPAIDAFGGLEKIEAQIRSGIQGTSRFLTAALLSTLGKFPNLVLQLFLALITCFFLLIDGERFLMWVGARVPLPQDVQRTLSQSLKDTSVSVVWSTLAAAGTQAVLMFIAFLSLGVPGAFLAAGATFIFAWIPFIGSTPVWLGGIIYLFSQDQILKMIFMFAAGILTGVADNFVRPIVLKGRSNMHPLVSIVAIFGGIQIFGIFGVFLGPILAGALTALLQIWPQVGERFGVLPRNSSAASGAASQKTAA